VADVPSRFFTDACPTYQPVAVEEPEALRRRAFDWGVLPDLAASAEDLASLLLRLLASPNLSSRCPVYERYDHTIMTNTVVAPGEGDAALLRIKGTSRAIALSLDCNSRYCWLDPRLGAMHAVAEATRNVVCVGARPLAITNCLNFGNPQKPGGYFQLQEAVAGLAEACTALGVPVVSGNVSLYNESGERAVMPTPTVGVVGVVDRVDRRAALRWEEGQTVAVIGPAALSFGGSAFLATIHDTTTGAPPPLDLTMERQVQTLVRKLIEDGLVRTAHDAADGGLLVSLAEMAFASDSGIAIDPSLLQITSRSDLSLFGEGASRIVVAFAADQGEEIGHRCRAAAVPITLIGLAGGEMISIPGRLNLPVAAAAKIWGEALTSSSIARGIPTATPGGTTTIGSEQER